MTIRNDSVVAIDYTLKNDEGDLLDSSDAGEPLLYLHGHENIVPGLERALSGKNVGDVVRVVVEPKDGYGEHDPAGVLNVRREQLPPGLEPEVGMMLAMQRPDGETLPLTIMAVTDVSVTVDANHSLAGQNLHFHVTVRSVRDATDEELAHGHVHAPGHGHHH
jgi:FKBP-type peptidyl-prolyl cis-trans isomerase SlyD